MLCRKSLWVRRDHPLGGNQEGAYLISSLVTIKHWVRNIISLYAITKVYTVCTVVFGVSLSDCFQRLFSQFVLAN